MYLFDILNGFRRSLVGTGLLVLQVAFTFAVIANIYAMIDSYSRQINGDTGYVDEESLIAVTLPSYDELEANDQNIGDWRSVIEEDLNAIASTLGVKQVVLAHAGIPFQNQRGISTFDTMRSLAEKDTAGVPATRYATDAGTIEMLGLEVIAGRGFSSDDIRWVDSVGVNGGPSVILTQTLATALFPDTEAVGKQILLRSDRILTVVGVVKKAQGIYWAPFDQYAAFVAGKEVFNQAYLVRLDKGLATGDYPAFKASVMQRLTEKLARDDVERDIIVQGMPELKKFNLGRFIMINTIVGVVAILLVLVTALGNYGQMSYTILRRTKQIGIRRALGATRQYVMNYFMIENLIIVLIGVCLGLLLMVGLNGVILSAMGYGQLFAKHVIVGIVFMFTIGAVSAIIPIMRAMNVPPAIATRTV